MERCEEEAAEAQAIMCSPCLADVDRANGCMTCRNRLEKNAKAQNMTRHAKTLKIHLAGLQDRFVSCGVCVRLCLLVSILN